MFRLPIILLLLSMFSAGLSQDKTLCYLWDATYEMPDVDIELYHMKANINIKPYDTLLEAKVEFSFKTLRESVDSLMFETPELHISHINIDGIDAQFKTEKSKTIVYTPVDLAWQTHHKIYFKYTAKPTEGLYFVGWNDPEQKKRKQIWAHRPNHWLPYAHAIHTVDMAVTVPGDLKVFSNGVRQDVVTNKDDTKTWIYKMNHPHPFFSTCLVIGDYDFKTFETDAGTPLELWYYPDWENHFEPTYKYQLEMFAFFKAEFGFNYPWEVYRQAPVIDYMYGAMETTTATIFGDYLMVDEQAYLGRNYVNVNAHELAHQWFGNYISHLKHKDVWLTESFATYWAKMFEKHVFGEDYYQADRNNELLAAFAGSKRNNYSVGHSAGGRERVYQKGSLVLDMLRNILGDREFKAVMNYYLETYPYQTAETNDFLKAIRKVTGRSMEWFFEQWIYRGGEPEYKISFEELPGEVRIDVEQIHNMDEITGLFKMPFEFEAHYTDGSIQEKTEWIQKQYEQVSLPNPKNKNVEFLIFDPNRKVIKKVKFDRSYEQLIAQAGKSKNMIDRYDALLELRNFSQDQKHDDLVEIYQHETFHLCKGEIIAQITASPIMQSSKFIATALDDKDNKVRLAVLQNTHRINEDLRENYERILQDKSYINVELALDLLCSSFPEYYGRYLDRTRDEVGWRGKNIRMKWLEIAIERGDTAYIRELKNYTSSSYAFETRINAMNTLKRLNIFDAEIAQNILDALFYWNYKVRNAARECLKYFSVQNEYHEIIHHEIIEGNFTGTQMDKMEAWFFIK